ncbi:MAG: single-stranded DNA-binding protein [Bacteroidetes bacterium 41-46]|nr:MAG: single-stranded DNA-binding protein [Bacteroidetes bacterium 41-46]
MSLNKVMLIGNVGKDPEVRHLEGGSVMARLSLATTERYRDKSGEMQEQTEWHNIVCWRSLAERCEKYVKKGSQLFIEGRLRSRSWEDKSGQMKYTVEIVADTLQILGRKQDDSAAVNTQPNIQEIIPQDNGDLPF